MLFIGPILFVVFMIASFFVDFLSMKERIFFVLVFVAGFFLPPPLPMIVAIALDLVLTLIYKFRTA